MNLYHGSLVLALFVAFTATTTEARHKSTVKEVGTPTELEGGRRRIYVVDATELDLSVEGEDFEFDTVGDGPNFLFEDLEIVDLEDEVFTRWTAFSADGDELTLLQGVDPFGQKTLAGTIVAAESNGGTIYQLSASPGDWSTIMVEEVDGFDEETDLDVTRQARMDVLHTSEPADVYDSPMDSTALGDDASLKRHLRALAEKRRLNDDGSVIDIMVVYTNGAMCAKANLGSRGCADTPTNAVAIESHIQEAVLETNQAFTNSGISTKVNLVYSGLDNDFDDDMPAGANPQHFWQDVLDQLTFTCDPSKDSRAECQKMNALDWVHGVRDNVGADFVVLLANIGTYCGVGWLPDWPEVNADDAFSVTQYNCATGYYSFGHELAHNMGANHNIEASSNPNTDGGYNYGFRDPQERFRTIMSYSCSGKSCGRKKYFSNPRVNYDGMVAGSATADNARMIQSRIRQYAQFRPSGGDQGAGVTQAPQPTPAPTPRPTGAPGPVTFPGEVRGPTAGLDLQLAGGSDGGEGNMFNVGAGSAGAITVSNFGVHASVSSMATVEVYKLIESNRSFQGNELIPSRWELIGVATSFHTNGPGQVSPLPAATFAPVRIEANEIQAFYVTFLPTTNHNRYTPGGSEGGLETRDDFAEYYSGVAVRYPFGGLASDTWSPRSFNGEVFYERITSPTPGPTPATPGPTPATPNPTPATPGPTPATPNPTPATPGPTPATPGPTPATPGPTPATKSPTPAPVQVANPGPAVAFENVRTATTMASGNGNAGNMFTLQNDHPTAIYIDSFDLHLGTTTNQRVLVYNHTGSYDNVLKNENAWDLICDTTVKGRGSGIPTPLSAEDVKRVRMEPGERMSFYVTLTTNKIRYTNGVPGTTSGNESKYPPLNVAQNGDVKLIASSGKRYPFGSTYYGRVFNGAFYWHEHSGKKVEESTGGGGGGGAGVLETTFANRNGSHGNMFDVRAITDIKITNFFIHTKHKKEIEVQIHKLKQKNKSHAGLHKEYDMWEEIAIVNVMGKGSGQPTELPANSFPPIELEADELAAFWIKVEGGGIRYTTGTAEKRPRQWDKVFNQTDHLIFYEGTGLNAVNNNYFPRVWNGIIVYDVVSEASAAMDMMGDVGALDMDMDDIIERNTVSYDNGDMPEGWPCSADTDCASQQCTVSEYLEEPSSSSKSNLRHNSYYEGRRRSLRAETEGYCLDEFGMDVEDED